MGNIAYSQSSSASVSSTITIKQRYQNSRVELPAFAQNEQRITRSYRSRKKQVQHHHGIEVRTFASLSRDRIKPVQPTTPLFPILHLGHRHPPQDTRRTAPTAEARHLDPEHRLPWLLHEIPRPRKHGQRLLSILKH